MTVDWGIGGTIDGENDVDAFQIKLPESDTLTIYGNHDELTSNWSVTLHHADGSVVSPTPPVNGQDTFASQYDGITEGLYYVVVKGSATAKSDHWISVATNQPVPLPWVRTGVDGGMLMDLAGSATDGPQLVFMTSLDEVTSVPNEVDEVVKSDPVPVVLRNSVTSDDPNDVIFQTLGGSGDEEVTTQANRNPMDINKDGELSAADVLEVIHFLNLAITQSASSESASSLRAARSLTAEESSLDVNGDGAVTAADALVLINRMNTNDIANLLDASND